MAELTRVATIENENWEDEAPKFIDIKEQIEWTNNSKIC